MLPSNSLSALLTANRFTLGSLKLTVTLCLPVPVLDFCSLGFEVVFILTSTFITLCHTLVNVRM